MSSLTIILELGDIRRFKHPNQLTSYCGLDIIEKTSGGKEKKFGITKMGNRKVRTTVVEACQFATSPIIIGRDLRQRRIDADNEAKFEVDLEAQTFTIVASGDVSPFEISPYKKKCLLNGLDDIGYILNIKDEIDAYEKAAKNKELNII